MMPEGEQMMNPLNAARGDEFDKMFMQMMIEHHSKAIQEATPCAASRASGSQESLSEHHHITAARNTANANVARTVV